MFEVKSAICFIRENAEKYDLDGSHIALMGESAGAHLAALAALSAGCNRLKDCSWPNYNVSDEVQAVIAVYCPSDLSKTKADFQVLGIKPMLEEFGQADSMEGVLLGWHRACDSPEAVKLANPRTYVNANSPPFLFLHGDQDSCVPYLQSMNLASDIIQATDESKVEYHLIPGAHHDIHDFEREDLHDLEAAFLKKYL